MLGSANQLCIVSGILFIYGVGALDRGLFCSYYVFELSATASSVLFATGLLQENFGSARVQEKLRENQCFKERDLQICSVGIEVTCDEATIKCSYNGEENFVRPSLL